MAEAKEAKAKRRSKGYNFASKTFEEFLKEVRELKIPKVKITGYLRGNDRRNSSRITLYCYVSPVDTFKPEYGEQIASISSKFSRRIIVALLEEDLAALYSKRAKEWKTVLENNGIACLVHERPFKLF